MSEVEERLIQEYAFAAAATVAERSIDALMRDTSTLSEDDSGMENAWEAICIQAQGGEIFFEHTLLRTMRDIVLAELNKMPARDLAALWLQTAEGAGWHRKLRPRERPASATVPVLPCDPDDIAMYIIQDCLLSRARHYSSANISAFFCNELSEHEEEAEDFNELRNRLLNLMPFGGMDVWDWDFYFDDWSFGDLSEAAFADDDGLAFYAKLIANDFLIWVDAIDEFRMDYRQQDPDKFREWVEDGCLDFMKQWRANVMNEFRR